MITWCESNKKYQVTNNSSFSQKDNIEIIIESMCKKFAVRDSDIKIEKSENNM